MRFGSTAKELATVSTTESQSAGEWRLCQAGRLSSKCHVVTTLSVSSHLPFCKRQEGVVLDKLAIHGSLPCCRGEELQKIAATLQLTTVQNDVLNRALCRSAVQLHLGRNHAHPIYSSCVGYACLLARLRTH